MSEEKKKKSVSVDIQYLGEAFGVDLHELKQGDPMSKLFDALGARPRFVQPIVGRTIDELCTKRTLDQEKKRKREKEEMKNETSDRFPFHIRKRVLTDIGHASMCWEYPEHAGIFDTKQAVEIGDALCQFILDQIQRGAQMRSLGDTK